MESLEGTTELNLGAVSDILGQTSPDTLESALVRISDLRYMLRETHRAYTRSQMEIIKLKMVIGFLGCMLGAILVVTILEAVLEG